MSDSSVDIQPVMRKLSIKDPRGAGQSVEDAYTFKLPDGYVYEAAFTFEGAKRQKAIVVYKKIPMLVLLKKWESAAACASDTKDADRVVLPPDAGEVAIVGFHKVGPASLRNWYPSEAIAGRGADKCEWGMGDTGPRIELTFNDEEKGRAKVVILGRRG